MKVSVFITHTASFSVPSQPGNEVITKQQIKANMWDENPHICIPGDTQQSVGSSSQPSCVNLTMDKGGCEEVSVYLTINIKRDVGEVSVNVVSYFDTHTLLKCPSSPL